MSRPVSALSRLFIFGVLGLLAGSAAAEVPQSASAAADSTRILKALNAMRPLGREASLGPWPLFTEAAAGELSGLDAVATHLAETYAARYGLAAASTTGQNVVIYSNDVRYRAFVEADGSPSFRTRGHAGAGLAAFALKSTPLESRVAVVHELTHLLSQRALGDSIPPWLDEGIAEDLAWCRVNADGRLQPDTLDARDAAAGWIESAHAGRLLPLSTVLSPGSRLFTNPGTRREATTASAMLVRWCLAEPARAAAFRQFLKAIALGGASDGNTLAVALGTSLPELQKNFSEWLKAF